MEKPKVGDILYSLNIGNAARHRKQKLTPVEVKKVGRKYFTVGDDGKSWWEQQYHIKDWRLKTQYSPDSCLYATIKEYEDEKETSRICRKIKDYFEYGHNRMNVSLSDLKKIESILDADGPDLRTVEIIT